MGLHFVNSYSIFSASLGSYDFYRPKESFQWRDHWTWNQKTWVKSCHYRFWLKRTQGFINLRGHLWCPNLYNFVQHARIVLSIFVFWCVSTMYSIWEQRSLGTPARNLPLLSLFYTEWKSIRDLFISLGTSLILISTAH